MRRRSSPALIVPASALAAPGTEVVEKRIKSEAPGAKQVRESLVRVHDPLPPEVGAHPAACDWIEYLRFRHRGGPREREHADAVLVIIPGFLGGAGSFDQLARNTVRRAAQRGREIEYWSLDRRANCLEDDRGVRAAARAEDATIAWDYYWGGARGQRQDLRRLRQPRGRRLPERVRARADDGGLVHGAAHRDPRPARGGRSKVICGGHSLGGPLTAAFASWDFDGDPADQARRRLQAVRRPRRPRHHARRSAAAPVAAAAAVGGSVRLRRGTGAAPYVNAPPLTPETIQVPNVFGVGAYFDPAGHRPAAELPHTDNIDLSQRVLFSRDAAHFASDEPEHPRLHAHQRGHARRRLRRQLGAALVPALERRPGRRRAAGRQELPDPGRRHPGAARGADDAALLLGALPARSAPTAARSRLNDAGAALHVARERGLRPAPARADAVRGAGQLHRAVLPDPDPHRRRRRRRRRSQRQPRGAAARRRRPAPGAADPGRRLRRQLGRPTRARRSPASAAERARAEPRGDHPRLQPPRRRHRRLAPERRPPRAELGGARPLRARRVRSRAALAAPLAGDRRPISPANPGHFRAHLLPSSASGRRSWRPRSSVSSVHS